ncbi:hypothetical protein [Halobellus rufus]|uniref:hypothetical protein n=1 Tax=Halobellus rufus TaxID=1448860 RepID=UPI0012E02234|nr:hypothetical protein [Halobellus rufus]
MNDFIRVVGEHVEVNTNTITAEDETSKVNDTGTRMIENGWGENAGDPNSTGAWNGSGYEGAAVVDTTNNVKYVFRSGAWV